MKTKIHYKWTIILLAPIVAICAAIMMAGKGFESPAYITVFVTIVCALWWIFEPVPIPVTSLLPLSLFPLFGVLTPNQVGQSYGSPLILLLLGGFILSQAMQKSGTHKRLALAMVNVFGGTHSKSLVLGFMVTSAFLSMWISNTATTLMLLPVAMAILQQHPSQRLHAPLLLGIAYAASVGGIGTPIGTPPNIVFMQIYEQNTSHDISFVDWMKFSVPLVIIFIPLIWLWLTRNLKHEEDIKLPPVGQWSIAQKRVLLVFALTALAWITRQEPFGGWSALLSLPAASDASVALLAVVVMFLVPDGKGSQLLDWKTAEKIPWGILLLFGSGITIATAFKQTGLSEHIGHILTQYVGVHYFILIIIICLAVSFLTEITSNTATTVLLLPILAATALASEIDPRLLMVPATMSASCAFMLPVATAPNAIVFGSDLISIKRMMREGFILNFVGACIISTICYYTFC
tara:strand:- start:3015 stop:4400 length:1386 start_codon:yes stop_codon:yes gene_type:complete